MWYSQENGIQESVVETTIRNMGLRRRKRDFGGQLSKEDEKKWDLGFFVFLFYFINNNNNNKIGFGLVEKCFYPLKTLPCVHVWDLLYYICTFRRLTTKMAIQFAQKELIVHSQMCILQHASINITHLQNQKSSLETSLLSIFHYELYIQLK